MSVPRLATSIIITRGEEPNREVFLVRRSLKLRAFAGQWAFPGGSVDAIDREHTGSEADTFIRCAIRELLEETGILAGADADVPGNLDDVRRQLITDNRAEQWPCIIDSIDPTTAGFNPVCEITTPPISKIRFQTQFLHIQLPVMANPVIIPGELDEGKFFQPHDAVREWESGDMHISPPVLFLLRIMQDKSLDDFIAHAQDAAERFEQGKLHPAYFSPGIFLAPLQTPTIPPATATNTMIVGTKELYIVDPATPDPAEQQRLFDKLDDFIAEGKTPVAVLLTHHHIDHVGAVNAVSNRYNIPVRAHPETYNRIEPGFIRGEPLQDGEKIDLGTAPDGSPDWHLTAVFTPGHAVDHFCFLESRYHAAIVGDMMSTISTIVIDPPEGHMQTYLNSLELLQAKTIKAIYPAHGHVYSEGNVLIREYLKHRKDREQLVIDALDEEPKSLMDLVTAIYSDVPVQAHGIASRSLLAGLIKLKEDGISRETDQGWVKSG